MTKPFNCWRIHQQINTFFIYLRSSSYADLRMHVSREYTWCHCVRGSPPRPCMRSTNEVTRHLRHRPTTCRVIQLPFVLRSCELHLVSITRFPLSRFSPWAGLLRNPSFTLSTLRFSRGWVRKDGNLVMETGCSGSTRPGSYFKWATSLGTKAGPRKSGP